MKMLEICYFVTLLCWLWTIGLSVKVRFSLSR